MPHRVASGNSPTAQSGLLEMSPFQTAHASRVQICTVSGAAACKRAGTGESNENGYGRLSHQAWRRLRVVRLVRKEIWKRSACRSVRRLAMSRQTESERVHSTHLSRMGRASEGSSAADLKKTVTSGYIICLECGRRLKLLTYHLSRVHGMDPASYRAKWNLPSSYPMIARGVSRKRSLSAKARTWARQ